MKQLVTLLFCFLSIQFNTVSATSQPITYMHGTYCIEPYVHTDIDILSLHVEIQLVAVREIGYKITYQLQVTTDSVDIPFVYTKGMQRGPEDSPATRNMKITVDNGTTHDFSLDQEYIPEEEWRELYTRYENFPVIPYGRFEERSEMSVSYLPLPLAKGEHTLIIQYKATPDVDYSSPWNNYYYLYRYSSIEDAFVESGQMIVDVYPVDTTGNWKIDEEPVIQHLRIVIEPADRLENKGYLFFTVEVEAPWWVRMLDKFTFFGLMVLIAILLLLWHWWIIFKYRKKNRTATPSAIIWTGGLFIPILQFVVAPHLFSGIYNFFAPHGSIHIDSFETYMLFMLSLWWIIIYIPLTYLYNYILRRIMNRKSV